MIPEHSGWPIMSLGILLNITNSKKIYHWPTYVSSMVSVSDLSPKPSSDTYQLYP